MIELKKHAGVILEPSAYGFDAGAATFGCLFKEPDDKPFYLYYTGSVDVGWSKASIGVAKSQDGANFVKCSGNPLICVGSESVTPAVFRGSDRYWMVFAFKAERKSGRRLGIANADDPLGPWKFIKQLIEPRAYWEGNDVDSGPSIASLSEEEHLVFYSNVSNKRLLSLIVGPRYWYRRIGILRLRISGSRNIVAERSHRNPLSHSNGPRGSWNESVFCPGYFKLEKKHYLLPATSTYSLGFPYKQYIGLFEDSSPFFENPSAKRILVDGPKEKKAILPKAESEIALDTPSPLIGENELRLYYSLMDRADGVWKTALSIFSLCSS